MNTLTPGDLLRVTRQAAGLGSEGLDVSLLRQGDIVRYVRPAWLLVEMESGACVEIHVDALQIMEVKNG